METPPDDRATRLVHPHPTGAAPWGALVPPVFRASTYHQADPYADAPYDYARSGNPTRGAFEAAMAELEGGARGLAFASGNAAITAFLMAFSTGDHLIVTRDCQGGTQRLLRAIFSRFGITATYVDTDDVSQVAAAITPATAGILVENFSNPYLRVTDIAAVARVARPRGLILAVDNTFLTPYLQNPLALGADVVVHSATKMIGGHSDLTAGIVVTASPELGERIYLIQNAAGAILSPDDAYMALRGLSTLAVRMERAMATAMELARWLAEALGAEAVCYPGLESHPGHEVAARTMRGFGQMITFRLESRDAVRRFVSALRITAVGAGFGGTETILSLPERHCHAALTAEERAARHIGGDLIRVSVGLESPADLRRDFAAGLQAAATA